MVLNQWEQKTRPGIPKGCVKIATGYAVIRLGEFGTHFKLKSFVELLYDEGETLSVIVLRLVKVETKDTYKVQSSTGGNPESRYLKTRGFIKKMNIQPGHYPAVWNEAKQELQINATGPLEWG